MDQLDIRDCVRHWHRMAARGDTLEELELVSAFGAREELRLGWDELTAAQQSSILAADAIVAELADSYLIAVLQRRFAAAVPEHYARVYYEAHRGEV